MSYEGIAISLSIKAQALGKKPKGPEVFDNERKIILYLHCKKSLINTFALLILFEYQEN